MTELETLKQQVDLIQKRINELDKPATNQFQPFAQRDISDPCKYCSVRLQPGWNGICHCVLGGAKVTC